MAADLSVWQWALLLLAAFLIGVAKTGMPGLGSFAVAVFALSLPPRASVGVVLPVLITADLVAVAVYRRHAVWAQLIRLVPWAAVGVIAGYLALGQVDDRQAKPLIGAILLVLVVLHGWRLRQRVHAPVPEDTGPQRPWFRAMVGILAGFTTMIANAAGPLMTLYLLAMRLPKLAFIGTTAWYFLLLNLFKVPFSVGLGLISVPTLTLDLRLAPAAVLGALAGRVLMRAIKQEAFETMVLVLTFLTALTLVF